MVQTAGDNRAVHEHTYLVAQGVTEYLLGFNGLALLVRPLEYVVILQIYAVRHLPPVVAFRPWTGHILRSQLQKTFVGRIISTLIPKAQDNYHPKACRLLRECHYLTHVFLGGILAVTFVRVQGYLHLVGQGLKQGITGLVQKSSVCCQDRNKALLLCHRDKLRQMTVKQRFAHQVKVQELYPANKPVCKQIKLFHRHDPPLPLRLGAEEAIKIAHVGYFKVTTGYHTVFTSSMSCTTEYAN